MPPSVISQFAMRSVELLEEDDPTLYALLNAEYDRQTHVLAMVAASSIADPTVLACEGMVTGNVTTEGYPGARFHGGCEFVDGIEQLAIERAKIAFRARYANVQPHSGTSANEIVIFNLLRPGEKILGLELNAGGHLTHGARASVSGQYFDAISYGLDAAGLIDYEQVGELARKFKPKLIICGASAYPRVTDFKRFREIADAVGAFLLADISHIAGLVVAGEHPSPIDHAHFTTTSTYKQLYGPRGGLILMGKDSQTCLPGEKRTLSEMMQRAVFPFFQGTPNVSSIAAKARALAMVARPQFKSLAKLIVSDAQAISRALLRKGYKVLTGGSDTHIVLVDVSEMRLTGVVAERALEQCGIIVNRNRIYHDSKPAAVASGVRLGTNSLALRGMGPSEMEYCSDLLHQVLTSIRIFGDTSYELDERVRQSVSAEVRHLCKCFPIPRYLCDGKEGVEAGYAGILSR